MNLDLEKRNEQQSRLSKEQVDSNWNKVESALNNLDGDDINDINSVKKLVTVAQLDNLNLNTAHRQNQNNPHGVDKYDVGLSNVDNIKQLPLSQKASPNGVASLDGTGKVPASQLPASNNAVDSVNAKVGVVVLDADDIDETVTRKYITPAEKTEIASNTAHSQESGTNPHNVTKNNVGLGSVPNVDCRPRSSHTGTQTASTISDFLGTVRSTILTGLSLASSTIISTSDNVLSALGKLQGQITALKNNVLEKNNSSVFTPSQDYHPATKKYVDDNSGGGGTVFTSTPISGDGSLGSPITIGNNAIALNKLADGAGATDDILAVVASGNIEAVKFFSYHTVDTSSLNCSQLLGAMYNFDDLGYTGASITVAANLISRKAGGFARMLINRSTKPSVSGTGIFRELQSDDWVNGKQYELFLECVYLHPTTRANDVFHYQFRFTRNLSI